MFGGFMFGGFMFGGSGGGGSVTSVGYGPLVRLDGPPPMPQEFGLVSAALAAGHGIRIVDETDDRWMNGGTVHPYPPDLGDAFDQCASGSNSVSKNTGTGYELPDFGAMAIYLAETCTSYKVWNHEEFKTRALMAFTAVESAALAHEFLTGTRLPNNPYLADGNGTFPHLDVAVNPIRALSILENEIAARSHRMGVIHTSPGFATYLRQYLGLDNRDGIIRTINGTAIVADAGYAVAGLAPATHAAPSTSQEWIYATGPVDIRRSEVIVLPDRPSQALDRGPGLGATLGTANSVTYRAERYYLIDWDTVVQAAVLVDYTL